MISAVNAKPNPAVFLLWGEKAHKKARLVTGEHHTVIKAAHPTHWPNVKVPFVESRSFTQADDAMCLKGMEPITWKQTAWA